MNMRIVRLANLTAVMIGYTQLTCFSAGLFAQPAAVHPSQVPLEKLEGACGQDLNVSDKNAAKSSRSKVGRNKEANETEFVCEFATKLLESGELAEAEAVLTKELAFAERDRRPATERASLLRVLARTKHAQSNLSECVALMSQVIQIKTSAYGENSILLVPDLDLLGSLQGASGRYDDSERTLKRSLSIKERILGHSTATIAKTTDALGTLNQERKRFADAEAYFRRSMKIRREFFGESHRETLKCSGSLAAVLAAQGKFVEARPLLERLVCECEKATATDCSEYMQALSDLAGVYFCERNWTKGMRTGKKALDLYRVAYGNADSHVRYLERMLLNAATREAVSSVQMAL